MEWELNRRTGHKRPTRSARNRLQGWISSGGWGRRRVDGTGSRRGWELLQVFFTGLQDRQFACGSRPDQAPRKFRLTGQLITFHTVQHITLEMNRESEILRRYALPLDAERVIPPVCMEQTGDQGRPQDLAHLHTGHAKTQNLSLLFGNEIALHHLGHIGPESVSVDIGQATATDQAKKHKACSQ